MPLTDLVRFLNTRADHRSHGACFSTPFVSTATGVFVHFANLRLESRFIPVIEASTGKLHGHTASLQVLGLATSRPLSPEALFVLPSDDDEFIYLDRLVRTLHALNYQTQKIRGNLLLKVHHRHVMSVPADHGLAFEELLRPCGLLPEQITLEIDSHGIDDFGHLHHAVHNYQSRGYGIAISRFGSGRLDFETLRDLRPQIVKLDPLLRHSARPLKRMVCNLHALNSRVLIDGEEHESLHEEGIDLIQLKPEHVASVRVANIERVAA